MQYLIMGVCLVGENHYEDIEDLVADGLITLYMEEHNAFDLINKEPKLTRRPAVYSRRKSFHAHGLRMKYNSTLRDKNGTKCKGQICIIVLCNS